MSTYITSADYRAKITDNRLNMIISADTSILDEAEEIAMATVKDFLFSRYDTDAIFAKTGTARDYNVLRWCVNLALYYIYERIPDKLVPDRVKDNYNDTMGILLDISDGKKAVYLPHKTDDDDNDITKFRWGSQNQHEH